MAKYLFFKLASMVIPRLPVFLAYGLAWIAAELAFRLARRPREAVASNLRHVLCPDGDAHRRYQAVRSVFHTAAYNYIDMFLIPRISPDELAQRVAIQNVEAFLQAYAQGKGIVLATAHLGNFDLLVQVSIALRIPVTVLVERLAPDSLFDLVVKLRSSHGVRLVPTGPKAVRKVLRALRAGEVVAIAVDRDRQHRGVTVPFFGEETELPAGAIELALHTGAALVLAFGLRLPGRRYRITVESPLDLDRAGHDGQLVAHNLPRVVAVLERHLREHPEQWIVFEPLWGKEKAHSGEPRTPEPEAAAAR